jgi:hypothetical protein
VADADRSIFFGLRTNVQFFASNQGFASLANRLKVFSLLYDRIVVEGGVYTAHVGESASSEFVTEGPQSAEDLRPVRTRKGTPWGMTIQREGSEEVVPLISSTLVKTYRSQFYSILQPAIEAHVDWIRIAQFTAPGNPLRRFDEPVDTLVRKWAWDESGIPQEVYPRQPPSLREKAFASLNLDLARAVVMGLDFAPDGIHQPLLMAKAKNSLDIDTEASGSGALLLMLPDVRTASWSEIKHLRRDKSLQRLRDRLREIEAGAPSEALLQAAVREALLKDIASRTPSWRGTAISVSVNVVASAIPGLSTIMTSVSAGKEVADNWKNRNHWTAALLRARKYLRHR